ncbi:MAG: OmpA family protein [Flammeovirgaceae bacterium]|nr:OmpA family protein [Flammeovirgaceae bacterium]
MKRILLTAILFCLFLMPSQAQDSTPKTYYVIIGAFAKVDNAILFTKMANEQNFQAAYAMNPLRKLYYVHVLETQDRRKAFAMMIKMRAETEHKETWVFIGSLGEKIPEIKQPEPEPEPEPEPVQPVIEDVPIIEEEPVVNEPEPVLIPPVKEEPKPKPPGNPFYFKLVNENTGQEVRGEVHIQESSKASEFQRFNGNELIYLTAPKNTKGTYFLSVQAPGFKYQKMTLDYKNPTSSADEVGNEGEAVITLNLIQARKGDYIEFNEVRFYRNSSIFQPESQAELDGLVDLMKGNLKYKIRIHGHVNGKNDRDITHKGSSSNFFDMGTGNIKESASSKKLSELRAEVAKDYLISQGIDGDRIKIKGEGGVQMIYGQNSTLSGYNDRIEIEVIKH